MNTQIILQQEKETNLVATTVAAIVAVAEWLCKYYSTVLEREVSMRQTLWLVAAQLAFVVMVLPVDASLAFRVFGVALFAWTVKRCKKEMAR